MNTVVVMIINPIQLLELFAPPHIFFHPYFGEQQNQLGGKERIQP
jgi:hypothetical protein